MIHVKHYLETLFPIYSEISERMTETEIEGPEINCMGISRLRNVMGIIEHR